MSGSKTGGIKASQTIINRYGEDYYRDIGRIGGKKSKGGFNKITAKKYGKLSRRGYKLIKIDGDVTYYKNKSTGIVESKTLDI